MQIKCNQCEAIFNIDESKVPEKGAKAKCTKCGAAIIVQKKTGTDKPTCPKCGAERKEGEAECVKCGVVYVKFRVSQGDMTQERNSPIRNHGNCNSFNEYEQESLKTQYTNTTESNKATESFSKNQIFGLLGSIILFVGVFLPIYKIPIAGTVNYAKGNGVIVIALLVVSLYLSLANRCRSLRITGILTLGLIIFDTANFLHKVSEAKDSMRFNLANNMFSGLADNAMRSIQIEIGFPVLIIGSLLLVFAGFSGESAGHVKCKCKTKNIFYKFRTCMPNGIYDVFIFKNKKTKIVFPVTILIVVMIVVAAKNNGDHFDGSYKGGYGVEKYMLKEVSSYDRSVRHDGPFSAAYDDINIEIKNKQISLTMNGIDTSGHSWSNSMSGHYTIDGSILTSVIGDYSNGTADLTCRINDNNSLDCKYKYLPNNKCDDSCKDSGEGQLTSKLARKWYTSSDFKKYNKLAMSNDATAQYIVANMYFDGEGCEKDHKKGYIFLKRSADNGYAKAEFALGFAYAEGREGLGKNQELGYSYLKRAAKQGNKLAAGLLTSWGVKF